MTVIGWQRLEGYGMAVAGLWLASTISPGWPWWGWALGLLAPDLAMAAYLVGARPGAAIYNLAHLYAMPALLMIVGAGLGETGLVAAGGLWLTHIGLDRGLGYGLKRVTGFRDTHLGRIGLKSR